MLRVMIIFVTDFPFFGSCICETIILERAFSLTCLSWRKNEVFRAFCCPLRRCWILCFLYHHRIIFLLMLLWLVSSKQASMGVVWYTYHSMDMINSIWQLEIFRFLHRIHRHSLEIAWLEILSARRLSLLKSRIQAYDSLLAEIHWARFLQLDPCRVIRN